MTSSKKMCSYRGLLLLISIILVARARKSEEEGGCCCAVELVILHAYVDGQRIEQQSIDLEPHDHRQGIDLSHFLSSAPHAKK